MALERGVTYIELRAKLDQYRRDLEAAEKDSGAAGSRVGRTFSQKMDAFSKKAGAIGSKLSTRLTLPLIAAGTAAFNLASDLNESLSKVGVVFADNAKDIVAWSKTSATAMGISRQEALEAAGTFGNLFSAMDIGAKPTADMSKSLVQLAADLASFNNADPTEVLVNLRAGLLGEAEPLRKFGVQLSAARIQEEALRMGLAKQPEALTAANKAQAAYQIILQDTKKAHGDFARTADGAANRQRILTAQFKNAGATIGKQLLPIGTKLLEWGQKLLIQFQGLSGEGKRTTLIIAGLAAALGPTIKLVSLLATKIGLVVTAVAVVTGVVIKYQKQIARFVERVEAVVERVTNAIRGFIDLAIGPIDDLIGKLLELIGLKDEVARFFQGDLSHEIEQSINDLREKQNLQGVGNAGSGSTLPDVKGGTLPRISGDINVYGTVVGGTAGIKELKRIQDRETRRSGVLLGGT